MLQSASRSTGRQQHPWSGQMNCQAMNAPTTISVPGFDLQELKTLPRASDPSNERGCSASGTRARCDTSRRP